MTQRAFTLLAAGGSAALLIGAFLFQYVGGLSPCQMCLWQRWPHAAALVVAVGVLALESRVLALFGAAFALITAGMGFLHVGVEQAWWEGPTSCSASDIQGMSADALLDQIMAAPLVRCDDIAWSLAGISMAGWNALISLALCAAWVAAFRQGQRSV